MAQQRNSGTNKNWISLERIHVPQPRGFVQCEMAGEQRRKGLAKIQFWVVVRKANEVVMKIRRLGRESLEEKIIGRSFSAGVESIEAQR